MAGLGSDSRFDGKVVFITGASSGIGAALAREFAAQGADLVLGARRTDRLEALAAELKRDGRRVLTFACDVTQDGCVEGVVAAAREALGRPLDVVVANAGFGVADRVERLTLDDFRRQFETNVFGVLRTFYATLDDLKQTRGRLAVVGSIIGFVAPATTGAYALSKFSVRALAYLLNAEMRPYGVSVTHIAPGFVTSEIFQVNKHGKYDPQAKVGIPAWARMPAAKAARHIVRAVRKRKREAVITMHGKAIVWVTQHAPWLTYGVLGLVRGRWRGRRDRA